MSLPMTIMDPSIGLIHTETGKVGSVDGVKFYFSRKTVDSNLPIEVSFVRYNGVIHSVCSQLNDGILREDEVSGKPAFLYKNDIVFFKNDIDAMLDNVEETGQESIEYVGIIEELTGLNLASIANIGSFEFDRILYVDDLDSDIDGSYFSGYYVLFKDRAIGELTMGVFVGELKNYTYKEFLDIVNGYSKNRVLSEVSVSNNGHTIRLSNSSDFKVELSVTPYSYAVYDAALPSKRFEIEMEEPYIVTLDSQQSFEIVSKNNLREKHYTLLNNKVNPPAGPIFARDTEEYRAALEYITEAPPVVKLEKIKSPAGAVDPSKFIVVSEFHDIFLKRGRFNKAVLDKESSIDGVSVFGDNGTLHISSGDTLNDFIGTGTSNVFVERMKVLFKTKLRKIYSYLGEDVLNLSIDYTKSSYAKILSMQKRIVYNDTISTPQQAFVVTIGIFGNIKRILEASRHIEYGDVIAEQELPCKSDRDEAVKRLLSVSNYDEYYVEFNANDVINSPTKPVYQGPLYRTYDGEVDDAYSLFISRLNREIDGFSMPVVDGVVSSRDIAEVMPSLNMRRERSSSCRDDFVLSVEEQIAELGLELSVEDALRKLRRVAYMYREPDEIVATVTIGVTLDGQWYFCGEDFWPAESIENKITTTFLDNDVIKVSEIERDGFGFIGDKKIFFDSNDWNDDYKQYMHDMYMAVVCGLLDSPRAYENPGMRYMSEHMFDRRRKLSLSYDEIFTSAKDVIFNPPIEPAKNTLMMPNVFSILLADDKIHMDSYVGDDNVHYVGKERILYVNNYSDFMDEDTYDSAYEVGHSVDVFMNYSMLKNVASLGSSYGKTIFGVNISDFGVVDDISVKKTENVVYGGINYGFELSIYKNNEKTFAILYDYKTKKMAINNIGGHKIVNYPLMLASFDIILHDYYRVLEGYKRVALGVYAPYHDDTNGKISEQFLLTNRVYNPVSFSSVHAIYVSAYEGFKTFGLDDTFEDEVFTVFGADGEEAKVYVSFDGDSVKIVTPAGVEHSVSITTLSNMPFDKITVADVTVGLYRTSNTLPARYEDRMLKMASIKVVGHESDATVFAELGDLKVVPFGHSKSFVANDGSKICFALGGEGLVYWKDFGVYTAGQEIALPIDDVVAAENELQITIDGTIFAITFE